MISALLSVVFGGVYLILPFILDAEKRTIFDLLLTVLVEAPAILVVYLLIDSKAYGGRKRITLVGCFFQAITFWVLWHFESKYLVEGLATFKFFTRITFVAFYALVTESYTTLYRSIGIGSM